MNTNINININSIININAHDVYPYTSCNLDFQITWFFSLNYIVLLFISVNIHNNRNKGNVGI